MSSTKPLQLRFVITAMSVRDLPGSPAEIAVVGRSNVGKSSLLNALANHRQLAKVSNTPGRTQAINLFVRPDGSTLVDLPGYGYAQVPGRLRDGWQEMIEGYLLGREPLVLTLVLVDGEIGPTKLDIQMLEWLRHEGVPHGIVATKLDKFEKTDSGVVVTGKDAKGQEVKLEAEMLLVAVGRMPYTEGLGLEGTKIKVERGFIQVDEYQQTGDERCFACGLPDQCFLFFGRNGLRRNTCLWT